MSSLRHLASASAVALSLTVAAPPLSTPVLAQSIVFDPNNYVQNVLTAARELQQINHQITSLQQLQSSIQRTQQLLAQAQNITFNIQQIDHAFQTTYGGANASQSSQSLIANAQARWQNSVAALQDALRVQAGVVGNLDTNRTQMSALVTSSQSATGGLAATQAGNQLLALQAQQLADLTAAVAAQGRAQNLQAAQQAAAQDQAREQLRRFLNPGTGYQSTTVTMFHP